MLTPNIVINKCTDAHILGAKLNNKGTCEEMNGRRKIPKKKRKRGRPRNTWQKAVKKAMSERDLKTGNGK
ncbi:hypothetical protein ILUMI_09656 [Ignelater luminosus]|uniref:Uncharacterized protein n=1 Tax=Ignelater luminosus TaxID=2038154 RepID=A0A8K0GFS0_IGNLU|nr:hypothetical protein ILUMI_09656 [Ignelater luminosus]